MRESLEMDLYESRTMQERAASEDYAVELYNALCGIAWQKGQCTELWSCTWRRAGEIVARLRSRYVSGDYLDFYLNFDREDGEEGIVTERVRQDLAELGWKPVEAVQDAGTGSFGSHKP